MTTSTTSNTTNSVRHSLLASFVALSICAASAGTALADPSAGPSEPSGASASGSGSAPATATASPATTRGSTASKRVNGAAPRPRAKVSALDGVNLDGPAASGIADHKGAGSPLRAGETHIVTIGDARADGAVEAGSSRHVTLTAEETTVTSSASQVAHRTLLGSTGGAGKEASDAIESALPKLVACLPEGAGSPDGEVLVKAAVGGGGAVLSTTVGSFSAVSSGEATCLAAAFMSAHFDARRTRSAIVPVHLHIVDIEKRRVPSPLVAP